MIIPEVLRLDPGDFCALINRGIAWKTLGRYGKAIADYNRAIQLRPTDARCYNNRGMPIAPWAYFQKPLPILTGPSAFNRT